MTEEPRDKKKSPELEDMTPEKDPRGGQDLDSRDESDSAPRPAGGPHVKVFDGSR